MGDHEYHDTKGGESSIMNNYLNPLALSKTYYAYDFNNVHFSAIDPYVDYAPGSSQYNFIENDLKTASTNPKIDWIFVMEHVPYTPQLLNTLQILQSEMSFILFLKNMVLTLYLVETIIITRGLFL